MVRRKGPKGGEARRERKGKSKPRSFLLGKENFDAAKRPSDRAALRHTPPDTTSHMQAPTLQSKPWTCDLDEVGPESGMVRTLPCVRPMHAIQQLRPYTPESTGSRPISEVKLVMAQSVLWWGTTREYVVL